MASNQSNGKMMGETGKIYPDPEPPCEPDWVSAKMSRLELDLLGQDLEEWDVEKALRERDDQLREAQFAEDE